MMKELHTFSLDTIHTSHRQYDIPGKFGLATTAWYESEKAYNLEKTMPTTSRINRKHKIF